MFAIEIKNIGMVYLTNWAIKKRVLENLSLEINQNEVFGMLGHNGAGKTTTIKILMNICHCTEGEAYILGKSIKDIESRLDIGFLPEDPYFYEYLTAIESIEFYGRIHGLSRKESRKRGKLILEELGLKNAINKPVRQFSKGMKQRLGFSQAIIHNPKILILDEPLTGLDPIGRLEIREKILSLKDEGKTIFFSSHVLPDVEFLCDRISLLSEGKLLAVGKLNELLEKNIKFIELVGEGFTEESLKSISFAERIVKRDDNTIVTVKTEEEAQKVKNILEANGGTLKSLVLHREALEDYYIRKAKGVKDENTNNS